MRHRRSGLSTYGRNGYRQRDELPAYAPDRAPHDTLYLYLTYYPKTLIHPCLRVCGGLLVSG